MPCGAVAQRTGLVLRTREESDEGLAAAAAAGGAEAFGVLAERHAPALRRAARAILLDEDETDDAVQDGVLQAWRAVERYDPSRPFRPWLMRIVVNAALEARRRRLVRRTEALGETHAAQGVLPDRAADHALLHERLRGALARLPERQRIAVVLYDVEGYAHAEIAEVLGVPEGTVRSCVFHGRRALRDTLAPFRGEG